MPIRNPFTRRSAGVGVDDHGPADQDGAPGFERVDTVGSKAPSVLSIRSSRSQDTGEYKMSVVNDSGVYLPPSPPGEKGQWPRKYLSRTSTETRSSIGDIEPFSISRESFDSYRRSFDITARSPISPHDVPARASLDSARFPRLPRSTLDRSRMDRPAACVEEPWEDVGLDDQRQPGQQGQPGQQQQQRRRGFFSKFSDVQDREPAGHHMQGPVSRFLIPGRKRGQSGQGSELGSIDQQQQQQQPPPSVMVTSEGQDMR